MLAALGGYLLGRLVLRMRTIYLSIATWAFAETYRIVLTAAYDFTRGDLGLSVPSLYGHVRPIYYYYTFVAVAAACVLLTHVILRSPIGYFMRAVKDDQMRAQSLGVDTTRGQAVRLHGVERDGRPRRRALCALRADADALAGRLQRDGEDHHHRGLAPDRTAGRFQRI